MWGCGSCKDSPKAEVAEVAMPKVTVFIGGAWGVTDAKWFPGTDRFLYCTLKAAGGEEVFRTSAARNVVDPTWTQETAIADVSDALEFNVWEEEAGPKNQRVLLGQAILGSDKFDQNGFNGKLPLRATDREITGAYLKVKAKVEGQEYPPDVSQDFEVAIDNPKKKT